MRIHYYSGWFDEALPEQMLDLLRRDLIERKSLALVWGCWALDEYVGIVKDKWFDPANIVFDEYHAIDPRMPKEEMHTVLKDASAILMMGGDTVPQNAFLTEYELAAPIRESNAAVIMGFSAGANNMGVKSVCAKYYVPDKFETWVAIDGLGLDSFAYEPYFNLDKTRLIQNELLPLSQKMDVYATSAGSFMRVEEGKVTVVGDGYLFSGGEMKKIG